MIDEDRIPPRPLTYGDIGRPLAEHALRGLLKGNPELSISIFKPPRRTWLLRWWLAGQLQRLADWIEP